MTHDRMFNRKSLISRPQKNQSCQSHLSTKQSSPSTPAPGDHLLPAGDILNQAPIYHPRVMLTPASMVTRPPGVPPCIMETTMAYQLLIIRFIRHINIFRHLIPFTLIILPLPYFINQHLQLQSDTLGRLTHTGDQASMNSFSRFTRLSCISAGNG